MSYTLLPGVQQDHRGRYYQFGRYPNGKLIHVPVEQTKSKGWVLPDNIVTPPPIVLQNEPKAKTRAVVEWKAASAVNRKVGPEAEVQAFVLAEFLPLMRFTGRRWIPVTTAAEWFVQYFEENRG